MLRQLFCCKSFVTLPKSITTTSIRDNEAFSVDEEIGTEISSPKFHIFDPKYMENQVILNSVFCFIPSKFLLSFRLVSKVWNEEASKTLQKRIKVLIISESKLEPFANLMENIMKYTFFERYCLTLFNICDPVVSVLLDRLSQSITSMVVTMKCHELTVLRKKMMSCPNLEEVLIAFEEDDGIEEILAHFDSLLGHARNSEIEPGSSSNTNGILLPEESNLNLKTIAFASEFEEDKIEQLAHVPIQLLIAAAPKIQLLNFLNWPIPLNDEIFVNASLENLTTFILPTVNFDGVAILAKKKMENLSTLLIALHHDVKNDIFYEFLQSVSKSLTHLDIGESPNPNLSFRIPCLMKELRKVKLVNWTGPIEIESIALNTNAPKLSKLQFTNVSSSAFVIKTSVNKFPQHNAVTGISYNYNDSGGKRVVKNLKWFISVFPNMKEFICPMSGNSDKLVEMIFEGWPNLESLSVSTTFAFTDSSLSGIPFKELKVEIPSENKLSCGCLIPKKSENYEQMPYIGKLTKLQSLHLNSSPGTRISFSNIGLHHGISQLKKLTSLQITSDELGPHWCLICIGDNLPNLRDLTLMDRSYTTDPYLQSELEYIKQILPQLKIKFIPTAAFLALVSRQQGTRPIRSR